ncbi:PSP1 C-terminal conserved region-domain-containing protein [Exophiala viscosa]|uniref:PSP1 C-terminal conserved region-domain-containing protein n=1 Tax=Exophiala viscosa TaxID=2486360 RepID=A0AAN6ICK6_9EURO|nr:PSP1 C-terminal conserved region-domain-containing protein [Exophiala viscosa]
MSNPPHKSNLSARAPMPAFGTFGLHQASASLLLEKSHPGLRRSTPDSEALASSDDEVEHAKGSATGNVKGNRHGRRTSWLNDVTSSNSNRKPSMTGLYSPSTSHPGTPGTEQAPWLGTNMNNPGATTWHNPGAAPYAWPNIWSQDARKDPPTRLQEVVPTNGEGIPFSIPLQPTPKTYRSQSYSVGQLDMTAAPGPANPVATSGEPTRSRPAGNYPSLQRRTSRTSGIGGLDSVGLGRLREVDDDEEEARNPERPSAVATEQARMIERLEKENAQLRQAAQSRDRTMSGTSATTQPPPGFRNTRLTRAVPEEAETAIDDQDEVAFMGRNGVHQHPVRRMSEQAAGFVDRPEPPGIENRSLEGMRKAHWQTSLGFGPIPEAPQSRRHSFADVPTRHGSISSSGEKHSNVRFCSLYHELIFSVGDNDVRAYGNGSQTISQGDDPEYFHSNESQRRLADARVHQSHQNYGQHLGMGQFGEPFMQPLFIVNFKCCRSDVFYIQEGTGLHVNVGDLVIVEADRGTDLGTVQHTNISWEDARRYKEYYAEEHYKWLMMFSLQSRNGGPNVVNPNGLNGRPGSAVGGMGPQGPHGPHDGTHPELKPKLIKRLAQTHEIQALKEKEGNEAKAKRVCQQKVMEHRLNMEILDAEFQMLVPHHSPRTKVTNLLFRDSKKLTFYYFADSYINFNHLVTDLFKIYKTRIWMSAINPASFQTPTASLGITPVYNATPGDERQRRRPQQPQQTQGPGPQQITTPFGDTFEIDRNFNNQSQAMRNPYYNQYQDVGADPAGLQQGAASYAPTMPGQMDPFMSFYGQAYPAALNPSAPNFATSRPDYRSRNGNRQDWMGQFQGLSLGS